MNELNDIGESLEASLAKDTLVDIVSGLGDYSIEMLLEVGGSIPFFSYFTKGLKATNAVRDFFFLEKVVEFLTTLGEVPTNERLKMTEKIKSDQKYSEKFGKFSLIALDRYDDRDKARLLGIAAKYLASNEISYAIYKRFSFIIGRLYINDILTFSKNDMEAIQYFAPDLESLGLITSSYVVKEKYVSDLKNYKSTPDEVIARREPSLLGRAFQCIVLEKPFLHAHGWTNMTSQMFNEQLDKQFG